MKSHTGVTHTDDADTAARNVVEGHIPPDTIFTDADPPVGGLRTWPQIQQQNRDTTTKITKLANLRTGLRKLIRTHMPIGATNNTIFSQILQTARTTGSDHAIHAYPTAPFRARRDSLEVAWGVHVHRCKRKHNLSLTCTKCQSPLTNTHILGGCRYTAKLRTKRHNSTFRLLL